MQPYTIIFPSLGSMGSLASIFPRGVSSSSGVSAFISTKIDINVIDYLLKDDNRGGVREKVYNRSG